jgi:hypothetical protein
MSTRATIEFCDEYGDKFYIYRGHDGFPETVLADLRKVINKAKGRWSGGGSMGLLISMFFGEMYNGKLRLQDYELTTGFHGDESYEYLVTYKASDFWIAEVVGGENEHL